MERHDRKIRWGILGTGKISTKFATALQALPRAEIAAVGSRSAEGAEAFGARFGIPRRYGSYEALAADPAVDVVYVGTPHVLHMENALLCLDAGKAVLCEKPFALNAAEGERIVRRARETGRFAMEAMWTRFLPLMGRVRRLLADGVLGELRMLAADFGFRGDFPPSHRLFNPALGGGALLDVGIYPVSLASMVWGAPARVVSLGHLGETGVDEQGAVILGYPRGELAVLYTAVRADTPIEADLMGTEGRIRIHARWHHPSRLTLSRPGREDELIEEPYEGNGLGYEALEVMRCLEEGRTESEIMPLDETLSILRTLDEIRAQWGLKYPGE